MSERKAIHLERLKARYKEAIEHVEKTEGERLRNYRKKIVTDGCFHPEKREEIIDTDNGYGRWWKVKTTKCRLCGLVLKTDHNFKG